LKPVVTRYRSKLPRLYFRANAGFANLEVYQYLEGEVIKYAVCSSLDVRRSDASLDIKPEPGRSSVGRRQGGKATGRTFSCRRTSFIRQACARCSARRFLAANGEQVDALDSGVAGVLSAGPPATDAVEC
jgi:hypothetical protein